MSRSDGDAPRTPTAKREAPSASDDAPVANENGAGKAKSELPRAMARDLREPAVIGTPRPSEIALADDLLHSKPSMPSIPPLPAHGPWRSYKELVATLSGRLVEAQKPLRVLNAIKWEPTVWEVFKRSRFKDVPPIDADSYEQDLGYDPKAKAAEFEEILRDIEKMLPPTDEIAAIMKATTLQFRDVVRMLEARGTPTFYAYSRRLYGSPKDKYPDGKTTVRDSAFVLYDLLTNLQDELGPPSPRDVPAAKAVDILNARLTAYFGESTVRVAEDDGIFADAAAGSDYVKIRRGAQFTMRDIDILEVHEGWVHLASSLNGQQQPVAKWLSTGPPRTTAAQEGLAALMEIFTFRTYPRRARRLNDRVLAVDKAEDGADFAQVFDWYRTEGYDEEDCFNATRRVFRGGTTTGGAPFTKDICYSKGIVLNYAFIRACIEHDRPELIPFLFVGKVAHEDVPVLFARANDGVVKAPRYLPPTFRDLNGLAIWMSYSTFFTRLGGAEVSEHYARIFRTGG
ncbi:MAG: flavohemoglobin expression-modulating QEGLA motif protein [Polyangiales bacterium]